MPSKCKVKEMRALSLSHPPRSPARSVFLFSMRSTFMGAHGGMFVRGRTGEVGGVIRASSLWGRGARVEEEEEEEVEEGMGRTLVGGLGR